MIINKYLCAHYYCVSTGYSSTPFLNHTLSNTMVTLIHLFKGEIIINSLLLVIIMSEPSQGTGTYDGALSASDKGDLLYDDIDEARVN